MLSKPQPSLNTTVRRLGFTQKYLYTTHPTPTQTKWQQYLSCYRPDFDKMLKVGSCEHLEQILAVRVTYIQATFVLVTIVRIRNISTVIDPILMKL